VERIVTNEATASNISILVNDVEVDEPYYVAATEDPYVPGHMEGTDAEDSVYPKENLLDLHPQKVSKSSGTNDSILISVVCLNPTSAVSIFNTNAATITVEVLDVDGNQLFTPIATNLQGSTTYEQLITDMNKADLKEYFISYDRYAYAHVINIYLSGPVGDTVINTGIVFAGLNITTRDASLGMTTSFKNYSIVSELASGATYILQRPRVRTFTFDIDLCVSGGDVERLKETFLEIGPHPIPWVINSGNNEMWLVFARTQSEPTTSFYTFNRSKNTINLIEVL